MKIRSSKPQEAKTTTITTKILGHSELVHYQLLTHKVKLNALRSLTYKSSNTMFWGECKAVQLNFDQVQMMQLLYER